MKDAFQIPRLFNFRSYSIGASGAGEGQFSDPYGVAVGSAGEIVVADRGNDRIQIFNGAGVHQLTSVLFCVSLT